VTDDNDKYNGVTSPKLNSLYNIFSARHARFQQSGTRQKFNPAGHNILSSLILRPRHYTLIFNTKDRKVKLTVNG
jgi:hypothetical protein